MPPRKCLQKPEIIDDDDAFDSNSSLVPNTLPELVVDPDYDADNDFDISERPSKRDRPASFDESENTEPNTKKLKKGHKIADEKVIDINTGTVDSERYVVSLELKALLEHVPKVAPINLCSAKGKGTEAAIQPPETLRIFRPMSLPDWQTQTQAPLQIPHRDDNLLTIYSDILDLNIVEEYTLEDLIKDMGGKSLKASKTSQIQNSHLDYNHPPLSDISDIFNAIVRKAPHQKLLDAMTTFSDQSLRVVTMCSGTESPLLALRLFEGAFKQNGFPSLKIEHLASVEIEPFKQAYIQRNFEPRFLFRDVTEFKEPENRPYTAFGGQADQPEDIHMLIAGSSCIDYSHLNSKTKKFGEKGQSFSTMEGISGFALHHEPAIVILENVLGAPWMQIRDYWLERGYFGVVLKLDSKDYWIPQTRTRGYMIAFNIKRANEIGLNYSAAAKAVQDIMESLKQRATAPYTAFILDENDPELQLGRRAIAAVDRDTAQKHDWKSCQHRYQGYRATSQLGSERPVTRWRNNGTCVFSDYGWLKWARSQVERIWDTIDITFLKQLSDRDYDMTYKHRWLDLSQNVDRDEETRPWGIVSCITPSGMPFDTRRGGPILGRESLILQGIPIQYLDLNKETSRNLQNLAGNAMTTTVVGSAILTALISSHVGPGKSMFRDYSLVHIMEDSTTVPAESFEEIVAGSHDLPLESITPTLTIDTINLKQLALRSLRLCRCEGLTTKHLSEYRVCKTCSHTACKDCAGNPDHEYVVLGPAITSCLEDPTKFIETVTNSLPSSLQLDVGDACKSVLLKWSSSIKVKIPKESASYQSIIMRTLEDEVFFNSVKRGHNWFITYESKFSRYELHFESRSGQFDGGSDFSMASAECFWLLYAKPNIDEPAYSKLRELLSYPIARMSVQSTNLLEGYWQVWNPNFLQVNLHVRGTGTLVRSWEQKTGLKSDRFLTQQVFSQVEISVAKASPSLPITPSLKSTIEGIVGTYKLLPNCGTANGSLHIKLEDGRTTQRPVYMFLDPKPLGNAANDYICFAFKHDRLSSDAKRQILAHFNPGYRFLPHLPSKNLKTVGSVNLELREDQPCTLISDWQSVEDFYLVPGRTSQSLEVRQASLPPIMWINGLSCTKSYTLFALRFPVDENSKTSWAIGEKHLINFKHRLELDSWRWVLKDVIKHLPVSSEIYLQDTDCHSTTPCTLANLVLKWSVIQSKSGKKVAPRPFEDVQAVEAHEKAVKARADVVSCFLHHLGSEVCLQLKINAGAISHRLLRSFDHDIPNTTKISWQLVHDNGLDLPTPFPKLSATFRPDHHAWPSQDSFYESDGSAVTPNNTFRRLLWQPQRETLAWMLDIEHGKMPWNEWNCHEYLLPAIHARLESQISVSVALLGGVLADEVGAGKTTISLALIARDMDPWNDKLWAQPVKNDHRIECKATVIMVPKNLINQWSGEISQCFGSSINVIILKNTVAVEKTRIHDLLQADIILTTFAIFEENKYWSLMRNICCAPNVPMVQGRAFKDWLDQAAHDLDNLMNDFRPDYTLSNFMELRRTFQAGQTIKYQQFEAYGNGSQNIASKTSSTGTSGIQHAYPVPKTDADLVGQTSEMKQIAEWKPSTRHVPALLHMFNFKRVIVDEFTYLKARSITALQSLATSHRWLLSGTPPLSNYISISTTAALVGTRLVQQDSQYGSFTFAKAKGIATTDRTYREEFLDHLEARVPALIKLKNDRAEDFATKFVWQNRAQAAVVKVTHHYYAVRMPTIEFYIYHKAYQYLTGKSLVFGKDRRAKSLSKKIEDLDETLEIILTQLPNAESALLCSTAYMLQIYLDIRDASSSSDMFSPLVHSIDEELVRVSETLMKGLRDAFAFWNSDATETSGENPHLHTFLESIIGHQFGDRSTTEYISRMLKFASKNPELSVGPGLEPMAEIKKGSPPKRTEELKEKAVELNQQTRDLVGIVRRSRYLKIVKDLAEGHAAELCCNCGQSKEVAELSLLGLCGHVACQGCLNDANRAGDVRDGCPASGCNAPSKGTLIAATSYMSSKAPNASKYGSKIEAVVGRLEAVLSESKDEKALVFVQFEKVAANLIGALQERGVDFIDGTTDGEAIGAFASAAGGQARRVLLLQIDSSDAAGWNLQAANHVFFVAPYVTGSASDYEATMKQAVGRSFRPGQTKPVHVHHFLTSSTVEVNLLQARTGKKLVGVAGAIEVRGVLAARLVEKGEEEEDGEDLAGVELDGRRDEGVNDEVEGEEGEDEEE